jgi:hypothetical protein
MTLAATVAHYAASDLDWATARLEDRDDDEIVVLRSKRVYSLMFGAPKMRRYAAIRLLIWAFGHTPGIALLSPHRCDGCNA